MASILSMSTKIALIGERSINSNCHYTVGNEIYIDVSTVRNTLN